MKNIYQNVAVLGSGSWGTALACKLARNNKKVLLFTSEGKKIASEINNNHTNSKYLKAVILPDNVGATDDLRELQNQELIVIATPSYTFSNAVDTLKQNNLPANTILLIATKGLVSNPARLFSHVLSIELPNNPVAFIAGPNFAKEVAEGAYSLATIASSNLDVATDLKNTITSNNFIIDVTDDIITLQLAGIIKNIVAIKSGIDTAANKGENTKAALIINALKEIEAVAHVMGGKKETVTTPGVLGDLILTCYSTTSRNMQFGYELANATNKQKFMADYTQLVEGKESISHLIELIDRFNLNLPIINSVYQVLKG